MDDQFVRPAGFNGLGAIDGQAAILDAQAHLGGERDVGRHLGAHRADDGVQQFRLAEQRRTAAMAKDRRRRATEIDIDTGRPVLDDAPRVGRHEMRVGTEQLHAHRRTGFGTAGVEQFRAGTQEGAVGQHALGDPDEFADTPIVAADGRQHIPHQRIGQAFHRGEQDTGHQQTFDKGLKRPAL